MAVRETIDIEALLVRAYREKMVDRLGVGDARSVRALSRLILLGYPSVGGSCLGGIGSEGRDPSQPGSKKAALEREYMNQISLVPNALADLHDAVLDLPDFYVEQTGELDFLVWDAETAEKMGHWIDVPKHGDLITVYRATVDRKGGKFAVTRTGPERRVRKIVATNLMIRHGRAASRPDVSPVIGRRGRAIYDGRKHVVGYETIYETPLSVVLIERAEYAVWHACADLLAQFARVYLADLDVQRPSAPAAPWAEEASAAPIPFEPRKRAKSASRASQAA